MAGSHWLAASRWLLGLALLGLPGCGSAAYSFRINAAISRFEEAKTLGAEQRAPYEYYSAEVRIDEARRLAARAEYGSAIKLAKEAEGFSGKAIVRTREERTQTANAGATPTHSVPPTPSTPAPGEGEQ